MLYEYALDPSLLTTWSNCRLVAERFGRSKGRMISRFPSKWSVIVRNGLEGCKEVESLRIIEKLESLQECLLPRQHTWSPQKSWLVNAEVEHYQHPFRAVVAGDNPRNLPFVLNADDSGDQNPLWHSPGSLSVTRDASAMCKALTPMFDCCTEVVFIDPNFGPENPRHRRPFEAFMKALGRAGRCRSLKRIEYHLSDKVRNTAFFQGTCQSELPRLIPQGISVRFVRWQSHKQLHNRYVLTDVGIVQVGTGLDDGDGDATLVDDFTRLDEAVRQERWNDFVSQPRFTKVDEIVVVGE